MGCTNNLRMAKLKRRSNQSGAEPRTPNSSRVMGKIFDMPKQFKCLNFNRATCCPDQEMLRKMPLARKRINDPSPRWPTGTSALPAMSASRVKRIGLAPSVKSFILTASHHYE